ncbi:MAG: undecaprenyl-phosphate alpha-N-acetylglucosaminyl 1-phosphate transferase [Planctomycetaceae bacterium]|nr:undecaprenyl-phosphate alpha-N-acetylglucosaminyl 1-phosphate transferase [Planctomycetaceae bacterium]
MTFQSLLWFVAGSILPSLVITWLATFVVRRLAPKYGLLDQPNHRKVHVTPTPLGGGLAIGIGVILPFLVGSLLLLLGKDTISGFAPAFVADQFDGLLGRVSNLWVILAGAAVLLIVGLLDDRRGLDWRLRLGIQFGVAGVCVATQGWELTAFIQLGQLGWLLSVGLSVIWIVALINSFNMLDNMDGLSAGVAAIAAAVLAAIMLISPAAPEPQFFVAGFLFVLVGALLGFLLHNRPPAKIFMGDAGSYFVGFCIGVATLLATYAGYNVGAPGPHNILTPLCVMAVPLYDMTTVIWIRLREGRSPFEADKNHFSHRLVELGLTKTQAVLTIYLTTATCGLGGLLLHQVNVFGAIVIGLLILCVLAVISILESTRSGNDKP